MLEFVLARKCRVSRDRLEAHLAQRLSELACEGGTSFAASSETGTTHLVGWASATEPELSRSYVWRERVITLFSGVGLTPDVCALNANGIATGTDPGESDGAYWALQVDLSTDQTQTWVDGMGLRRMYTARDGEGVLLSSSAQLLARIVGARPDRIGVATFLTVGWPMGGRTLWEGVRAVDGGSVLSIDETISSRRTFSPQILLEAAERPSSPAELADSLRRSLAAVANARAEVECALTGGRDSRLCAALSMGLGVSYYCEGEAQEEDPAAALQLSSAFNLPFNLVSQARTLGGEEKAFGRSFIAQNDGMSGFDQIADHASQSIVRPVPGVKINGLGGEMARGGTGPLRAASVVWPFSSHWSPATKLLAQRAQGNPESTATSVEIGRGAVAEFVRERRAEGWPAGDLSAAFYAFERVARWGGTAVSRTQKTHDLFAPLAMRPFTVASFARSRRERYGEQLHWDLLTVLNRDLRDHPYLKAWERRGPLMSVRAARSLVEMTVGRRRLLTAAPQGEAPVWIRWIEADRRVHLEMLEQAGHDAAVAELINVDAVRGGLAGHRTPSPMMGRALAVAWAMALS